MSAASVSLMLRHELRLGWRAASTKVPGKLLAGCIIFLLVLMHLVALPFPFVLPHLPDVPRLDLLAGMSVALIFFLLTMTSLALIAAVRLLYARGDMELLLASPVPARSIVIVRSLFIALSLLSFSGLFILPFANVFAVLGYPRFLVAYVVVVSLALLATSAGLAMAQGLFRLLGPRRTRLFAQIMAAMMTLAFIFLTQMPNMLTDDAKGSAVSGLTRLLNFAPGEDSWLWLPARAALGEALPFIAGAILCAGLFALVTWRMADRLIASAISAGGVSTVPAKAGATAGLSARGGALAVLRRKEWLLIRRDPWLITQIAQQIVVLLPVVFLVWKADLGMAMAWLIVVFLAGNLAGALSWLTTSTEEAPDLLAAAPLRRADILRAKLEAALLPTAIVMAVPLAVATWLNLWVGFVLIVCSVACAVSCAALHMRYPTSGKRSDFQWRGQASKALALIESAIALGWVFVGLAMLGLGLWGLIPFALAVALAAFFMTR
jgi:ABC-2 type transport system permease protein